MNKKEIITTSLQKEKAKFIVHNSDCRLSKLKSSQLQNIAIEWSFYSGKIEGSTFSLVQTETLIKDDIVKGRYEDAVMHKNMYNILIQEMDYIRGGHKEVIDEKLIFRLHQSLTKGLISDEDRGTFRTSPVRVTGSSYSPPKNIDEIKKEFFSILYEQQFYKGIEKSIFLHCNLARLQPFIDGNKRTSRMVEGIVLMNNDLLPTFTVDEQCFAEYRDTMLAFYQEQDYNPYVDFMLDKQIEVVESLSVDGFKTSTI
ncbi:MAG: Fic family protein [Flavobacteriaceae bacterium]|nr:Fic family protein [Flavobacteriaceae bacterium]